MIKTLPLTATGTGWKFLQGSKYQIVSDWDESEWTFEHWRSVNVPIRACYNGFHCSPGPIWALAQVRGYVVAQVEYAGVTDHSAGDDKLAAQHMRIIKAWEWDDEDYVALAEFACSLIEDFWNRPTMCRMAATEFAGETLNYLNRLYNQVSPSRSIAHEAINAALDAFEMEYGDFGEGSGYRVVMFQWLNAWMEHRLESKEPIKG